MQPALADVSSWLLARVFPGLAALPGQLKPAWQGNKMNAMAPIRPAVRQRARRIPLSAGPAAPAEARRQVEAAIHAWDTPVDVSTAVLLTSELVTNAIKHTAGETVLLAITCACGQFHVDVHDTSSRLPVMVDGPADAEAGRGLILVASLSTGWGYYPTAAGKAVYFTLALQARLTGTAIAARGAITAGCGEP